MYIREASVDYDSWGRNTAVITFKDVDGKDIKEIRDMYSKRSDVTLVKNNTTTNGIGPLPDPPRRYAKEDVAMRNLKVEKVIFNEPATIVFWSDNTKTKAVCRKDDKYDAEKGFYICCAKKLFGNDFKAGGKINKALEKAIVQKKEEKTNEQERP